MALDQNNDAGNAGGEQPAIVDSTNAAAPAPAAKATTLIDDAGGDEAAATNEAPVDAAAKPADGAAADEPSWPADWREKLAGGDDKFLAHLKRYTSPANYAKAGFEAQQKIRSGEFKKQPGPDAKPEELAAWRKENGLPEAPEKYEFDLKGYIPPETDKPILDGFKSLAFDEKLPPSVANKMVSWYYAQQENAIAQQNAQDQQIKVDTAVALREEWQQDYKANFNAIGNFLDASAPEGFKDQLLSARLPDGSMLGNNAPALKWLASVARENMPGADIMPSGTANVSKGVDARYDEITQMQQTDEGYRQYWSSPTLQDEYRKLAEARAKRAA